MKLKFNKNTADRYGILTAIIIEQLAEIESKCAHFVDEDGLEWAVYSPQARKDYLSFISRKTLTSMYDIFLAEGYITDIKLKTHRDPRFWVRAYRFTPRGLHVLKGKLPKTIPPKEGQQE